MRRNATDSDEPNLRRPLKFSIDESDEEQEPVQQTKPISKRIFKHIRDTHRPPSYAHVIINRYLFYYFPRLLLGIVIIGFIIALLPGGWRVALCAADLLPVPALTAGENVTLIGHRGSEFPYPENSLQALQMGAETVGFVEFDIGLTKDGDVIVMHDQTLDRTTNGSGVTCERTTSYTKDLVLNIPRTNPQGRALPGHQCTKTMTSGQVIPCIYRVPTLAEVFDVLPSTTKIMIDIKDCYAPGVAVTTPLCSNCTVLMQKTKELMERYFVAPKRLVFTSTEQKSLQVFYDGLPKGSKYAISMGNSFSHYKQKTFLDTVRQGPWDGVAMSVGLASVRPDLVRMIHRTKAPTAKGFLRIYGWTIRRDMDLRFARCAGIKKLIVADPSRVLKKLSWKFGSLLGVEET